LFELKYRNQYEQTSESSSDDIPFECNPKHHSQPPSNSSLNRLTLLCLFSSCPTVSCEELDVPPVKYDSILSFVSCRATPEPPSLRPLTTSNPEDDVDEVAEVGDVTGEAAGEITVLIFVVRFRKRGMFVCLKQYERKGPFLQATQVSASNSKVRREIIHRPRKDEHTTHPSLNTLPIRSALLPPWTQYKTCHVVPNNSVARISPKQSTLSQRRRTR
jgi:hypothetical protein